MPSTTQLHSDEITLLHFQKQFTGYSWKSCGRDLMAALSVALLTVPQAMAYALLAGLPLSTGLFASIYSALIAAMFGSSRHLIVGPSSAIAILLYAGTSEILYTYYRGLEGVERDVAALQILTQLALVVGILQILSAGAKLGRLTQFVSHSVIVGYISGTAVAVIINQLFTFLGVANIPGDYSLYARALYLSTHLDEFHLPTVIVGMGSLLLFAWLRRFDKRFPAALIMFGAASLAVFILNQYDFLSFLGAGGQNPWQDVQLIGDRGQFGDLWPNFALPYFDIGLMNHLLPIAFAIALLSILETTSVAKTIAASSGQHLETNQEIFSLGLGNLCSSLICAMPISGSPSRSLINYSLGAKTRISALFNIGFVALILYMFSFLIMHIPMAALSALLLVTAVGIVQPKQLFLCIKATNSDAFVLWLTFFSCIFLSLDVAFYVGIVFSITLYLKKAAIPELVEYDIDEEGELSKSKSSLLSQHKTIRVIKVEGELFFGAADIFQTTLKTIAEDDTGTRVIILQLKNARDFDATVCLALQQLFEYLHGSGRHLIACGISKHVWDVLSDSGLVELIGKKNLFIFNEKHPHLHMVKALHRARHLVNVFTSETAKAVGKRSLSVWGGPPDLLTLSQNKDTTTLCMRNRVDAMTLCLRNRVDVMTLCMCQVFKRKVAKSQRGRAPSAVSVDFGF